MPDFSLRRRIFGIISDIIKRIQGAGRRVQERKKMRKRQNKIIPIGMSLSFLMALSCVAYGIEMNQLPAISNSSESAYNNYLNDTPPEIKSVTVVPDPPKAGEPAAVEALIFMDSEKTDSTVLQAALHFSGDSGKTWQEIPMSQSEDNEQLWTAEIPPMEKDALGIYYVSASDVTGNTATEMPGQTSQWPPSETGLALLSGDAEEKDDVVAPSMDILKTFMGYDEQYFYFKVDYEKAVKEGTYSPPFLHSYSVLMWDRTKSTDILAASSLSYMPLLKVAGYPETTFFDAGRIAFDYTVGVESKIQDNVIYFRVKRAALGKSLTQKLRVASSTFAVNTQRITESVSNPDTEDFFLKIRAESMGWIPFIDTALKYFRQNQVVTLQDVDVVRQYVTFQDLSPYCNVYLRTHDFVVK